MIPKISVLMPVFNGEAYLTQAIESILAQTFSGFELVILDDASTDRSGSIIRSFDDGRIRLLKNEHNQGLVAARNRLLEEARGELLAWLDCDDWAYPQRLEQQLLFMEANPQCGLLGSWAEFIRADGEVFWLARTFDSPQLLPVYLLFMNCFIQSSVMIRKSCLGSWRYHPAYPPAEDYELWQRLSQRCAVANLPQVLVRYRVHGHNISQRQKQVQLDSVARIIAGQLAALGIVASPEELTLHQALGHLHLKADKAFFEAARHWLLRLHQANRSTGRYEAGPWQQVMADIWAKLCMENSIFPAMILRELMYCPLSSLLLAKQRAKIALLCLKKFLL